MADLGKKMDRLDAEEVMHVSTVNYCSQAVHAHCKIYCCSQLHSCNCVLLYMVLEMLLVFLFKTNRKLSADCLISNEIYIAVYLQLLTLL